MVPAVDATLDTSAPGWIRQNKRAAKLRDIFAGLPVGVACAHESAKVYLSRQTTRPQWSLASAVTRKKAGKTVERDREGHKQRERERECPVRRRRRRRGCVCVCVIFDHPA